MLKQISEVNEFHSLLPLLSFQSQSRNRHLVGAPKVAGISKEVKQTSLGSALLLKLSKKL